jgi:prolipoprotein diacylglyceryltransferase
MKNLLKKTAYVLTGVFLPVVTFAGEQAAAAPAAGTSGKTATQLLAQVTVIIESIIPILIGAALLIFLWGVLKYLFSKDSKSKADGSNFILWGIISLFVMVALWGLVNLLQSSFLGDTNPSDPPREEIESLQKRPETDSSSFASGNPVLDLIKKVGEIIEAALPLLMLVGVLIVLWGILKSAFSSDSKSKETARSIILWGVIGLTVMAFVWSFVVILQRTVFQDTDPTAIGGSGKAVEGLQKDAELEGGGNFVGPPQGRGINTTILKVMDIVQDAIPLLISLGILLFIWGVFKYVGSSSAKIKSEGVALMTWGVIMLLIMGSVWYFVNLIAESTNISLEQQPNIRKETVSPGELILQ